jgi:VWFA-related protein
MTGDNAELNRETSAPPSAQTDPADTRAAVQTQTGASMGEDRSGAPTERSAPVASAAPETRVSGTSVPAPTPAPDAVVPEIAVGGTTELPDTPTTPHPQQDKNSTLRVSARLVDVGVVALDRKGRPVTDLKPEDFEIYDNGRKQGVQFVNQAGRESATESGHVSYQPVISNRRAFVADAKLRTEGGNGNITILLIDAGNLAWTDLTYARKEMLRFLRALPANELVGLYVIKAHGFQVLEESTVDHPLLGSKLSLWMPSAHDLARAQAEEQHSRQEFEEVHNLTDLQSVDGSSNSAANAAKPVDPQLRGLGGNQGSEALLTLVGVAAHLAALPGHKSLVWVTSDKVLANWNDKTASSDEGSKRINGMILRVQETMNDAHVAVYPLDASHLETWTIGAGSQDRNIDLASSSADQPALNPQPGAITAEMQQETHPVQSAMEEMAEATGGHALAHSGDITAELNRVITEGRAAYLLGFTPDTPADDQYHRLIVKLAAQHSVTLRYRTGYQYAAEASMLKDRFRQAIWQPLDANEIAVSANPVAASTGATVKLKIATNDLALKQQGERWVDKLDIFLVQRDDEDLHAKVTGRTMSLALKSATYQSLLGTGISFDQFVEAKQETGSIRIVVVDENSSRMGSVTVTGALLRGADFW